jgi:hypothetical protein
MDDIRAFLLSGVVEIVRQAAQLSRMFPIVIQHILQQRFKLG